MHISMARYKVALAVGLLLAFLAIQSLSFITKKSPTADELAHHIASGYSYLVTGNFKMIPGHPPFSKLLSAIPLWFLDAKAPLDHESWKAGNSPEFAQQFFYHSNQDADQLLMWARFPTLILSLLLGFLIFHWVRLLFGTAAAFVSLILYVGCPDIIAHSSQATTEFPIMLFFFLTCMSFWFYLTTPSKKWLLLTGIFAGFAFLSKFTAVLLPPILFLIAFLAGKFSLISFKRTIGFLGVCFLTIWAGYFFEVKPFLEDTPNPAKKIALIEKVGGASLVKFSKEVPIPLATFISGMTAMMTNRAQSLNAYLMGEWSRTGWWYYYFIAFMIKNTIPLILLFLLSLVMLTRQKWRTEFSLNRLTLCTLLIPIALFFSDHHGRQDAGRDPLFFAHLPLCNHMSRRMCIHILEMGYRS